MSEKLPRRMALREDALAIWRVGVQAVDAAQLVRNQIRADVPSSPSVDDAHTHRANSLSAGSLRIAGEHWTASPRSRICVVGAGKAGAGMAAGLEEAIGPHWLKRTQGWVNVPDNCVQTLAAIHLHGGRPPGLNEPTLDGALGTAKILEMVEALRPEDLCIVLISGGGSALLPAPIDGLLLADLQAATRALMRSGATIAELNCVRRALSEIKGGGLARRCRAGTLMTLIISDVIGDPLETIASGPTVDVPPDYAQALQLLQRYQIEAGAEFPQSVWNALQRTPPSRSAVTARVKNVVIGNNRTVVEAAAEHARKLEYEVVLEEYDQAGEAAACGVRLVGELRRFKGSLPDRQKLCVLSGGEPVVRLLPGQQLGKGGRNQELVLAATVDLLTEPLSRFALLSAGTDGEDGPTDAAGAVIDDEFLARLKDSELDPHVPLDQHNSYPFFQRLAGLIKTGPTHTNVMDLRVGLVAGGD